MKIMIAEKNWEDSCKGGEGGGGWLKKRKKGGG